MLGWVVLLGIVNVVRACTNGPLNIPVGSTSTGFSSCNTLMTGGMCTYTCSAGYTAGAAFAVTCDGSNNYDASTATCTPKSCTGGITPVTGSSVTGTPAPTITTGTSIAAFLVAQSGYTCSGSAVALCTTTGANAVTPTGYSCTANACTGGLTPPSGSALSGVAPPPTITTNDVMSTYLTSGTGYSCVGTPLGLCTAAGANAATATGYTCTGIQCVSVNAPTGATVVAQGPHGTGDVVNLQTQAGYTCSGTATALCTVTNGAAAVAGTYSCTSNICTGGVTPPTGSIVSGAVPASITSGNIITTVLSAQSGYQCSGTATAVCFTAGANPVSVTGYSCSALQCASISAPVGATVASQIMASTGNTITGNLQPQAGFSCTGTATALCAAANGVATSTGYTCTALQCSSIQAPTGATVSTQQVTSTGSIITANLAAASGYSCTGTATASCATANSVATVTGYTCTPNACTGGIVAPTGTTINGAAPASIATGTSLAANLVIQSGYSCTGTPTAVCSTPGASAVTVSGYTCSALQCNTITAPMGATVITQAATQTGSVVTANLQPLSGFTCTGTATSLCPAAGGAATVNGYTCTSVQCSSIQAPTGATVTTQTTATTGTVVTANLAALTGYSCTGTATASCATANGVATVTGYTCTRNTCTGGITAPTGSAVTGTVPATIASGANLVSMLSPAAGFVCTGTPQAVCATPGAFSVTVTGYTCTAPQCNSITPPAGSTVVTQTTARTNDVVTANLQQLAGYTCSGTATAVCSSVGGVATISGYTCIANLCTSLTPPVGATVPTQVTARTGDVVTASLVPATGYTCSGVATAACNVANSAASVSGYTCSPNSCTGGIALPAGASLAGTAPTSIATGTDLTSVLGPASGFTCSGTALATCPTPGAGQVSVTGFTCLAPGQCSSLIPPAGATVVTQGAVSPNEDVTSRLQALAGYTCTGTGLASCSGSGAATTTGYTCTTNTCTGGISAPAGSFVSGALPASITTGTVLSLTPSAGFACNGSPVANCPSPGGSPVSVTGYSCFSLQCLSITAPAGAAVVTQAPATTGDIVTANLQGQSGYTCSGVATALCSTSNGAASVTGYTCSLLAAPLCSTLQAPVGASVLTQVMARSGDIVTTNLQALSGWTCTGTAAAVCSAVNGVATTNGYTCSAVQCASITAPTGAVVATQVAARTGDIVTTNLQAQSGYTCSGTATVLCGSVNGVASVTGYTCTLLTSPLCSTLQAPTGASVVTLTAARSGDIVTASLQALVGWVCTGTATAVCSAANGVATTTGYTCTQGSAQCSSFTAPVGATITSQTAVTNGMDVTSQIQASAGYACTGQAIISCSGGVGFVTGYSCAPHACTGGITVPLGAVLSGVAIPASITTGTDVTSLLTPASGYTCINTAVASCATAGPNAVMVLGYACTPMNALQCSSLAPPTGAAILVQGVVSHGAVVNSRLQAMPGYSCSGTGGAVCQSSGGVATVSGYTCVVTTACASIQAPTGATVVSQRGTNDGEVITATLQQQAGYVCSGTALASCPSGSTVAVVSGSYSCTPNSCTGGINLPAGVSLSGVAVPSPIVSGTDITALVTAQATYTCVNQAVASCPASGSGKVNILGYTCIGTNQCTSFAAPTGAVVVVQGPVTSGEDVTSRLAPEGYVCQGTAIAVCSAPNGVAQVTGYTCTPNSCTGGITTPVGAVLSGIQVPSVITSGTDITNLLTAASGYMCVNAAIANCQTGGNGMVTVPQYTCYTSGQCIVLTPPLGTTVVGQGAISNGDNVLVRLQMLQGYTCAGTPTAVCNGGTATVTGYTCAGNTCSGGLAVPLGSTVSTSAPSSLSTGSDLSTLMTSKPGYTCLGSPTALCKLAGQAPAEVAGFSCLANQCFNLLAPPGATVVAPPSTVFTGSIVSNYITAAAGYTCTGTPVAVCTAQLGDASTSGSTCSPNTCSSVQAPAYMTLSGAPGTVVTGDTSLGSALLPLTGYMCVGTPVVICETAGGVARVSGMQCSAIVCSSGVQVPTGATTTIAAGQQLATGQDISQSVAPSAGYTCDGTATVVCVSQGSAATIPGYVCTPTNVCIMPKQDGYMFSGGQTCTTLSDCGVVSCASGYNGVPSAVCTGSTVTLTGCVPNQCSPPVGLFPGYVLTGGSSCTTVPSCGAVTCAGGYTQVAVPTVRCLVDRGTFAVDGCIENTCQAPGNIEGYSFTNPSCTKKSTCGVSCATGYSGTPVVTCLTNAASFMVTGCSFGGSVSANLPTRPWKRVRLTVIPSAALQNTAEMSAFVISLERKLSLSYGRYMSGVAELVVTLMCPANGNVGCFRPAVSWSSQRAGITLQAGQARDVDIIVADNTKELVEEDIRNLRLGIEQNENQQGPVYSGKPEFPLILTSSTSSNMLEGVPDSVLGGSVEGGVPVIVEDAPSDDDSAFPWWAIVLLAVGVCLLCLAVVLLVYCATRSNDKENREAPNEYDVKMSQHSGSQYGERSQHESQYGSQYGSERAVDERWDRAGSYGREGSYTVDRSASIAEAARVRQLQDEIEILEKQKMDMDRSQVGTHDVEMSDIDGSVPFKQWALGDDIEVLYSGKWFPARVNSGNCDQDGCWDVDWLDGTGSKGISYRDIRPMGGWDSGRQGSL